MKNNKKSLFCAIAARVFALAAIVLIGAGAAVAQKSFDGRSPEARLQEYKEMKAQAEKNPALSAEEKRRVSAGLDAYIKQMEEVQKRSQSMNGVFREPTEEELAKLSEYEKYYRFGSVRAELMFSGQKSALAAGEKTKVIALLENDNGYPVFDGQLYIEVLKENQEGGMKNGDYLFDRFSAAEGIAIDMKSKKRIEFDWQVPKTFAAGDDYKLAAYFTVGSKRYSLSGLTFAENVFAATLPFQVASSQNGSILFDRNNIKLNGAETVLRSANPSSSSDPAAKFEIPLKNNTQKDEQVKITYELFSWDSFANPQKLKTKEEAVMLPAGGVKTLVYEESESKTPIKFLLVSAKTASGQKSMLKLRWIDNGAEMTTRVNFAGLTKFPIVKGDSFEVFANHHAVLNILMDKQSKVEISLFDKSGKLIDQFSQEEAVSPSILNFSQVVRAKADYNWLKLVAKTYDDSGKVTDEGEIIFDAAKLSPDAKSFAAAKEVKKSKQGKLIASLAIALFLILAVALLIYMKKRKNISTLALLLMVLCMSVYLFQNAAALPDAALAEQDCGPQPGTWYCTTEDEITSQQDKSWYGAPSSPSMTVGAWQMAAFYSSQSVGIHSYLKLDYVIAAEKIVGNSRQTLSGDDLQVSPGEKIRFMVAKSGEYFTNGGSYGTPPAYWVSWNTSGNLFGQANKDHFANTGKDQVYDPQNYAETIVYFGDSYASFKIKLHTLLAAKNPSLGVLAGDTGTTTDDLLTCGATVNEQDPATGLFTGVSYVDCTVKGTAPAGSSQQVSFAIGGTNFQERLAGKFYATRGLACLFGLLERGFPYCWLDIPASCGQGKDAWGQIVDREQCWAESGYRFLACRDNIELDDENACKKEICDEKVIVPTGCAQYDEWGNCLNYAGASYYQICYYPENYDFPADWEVADGCAVVYKSATCEETDNAGNCTRWGDELRMCGGSNHTAYYNKCNAMYHFTDSVSHKLDKSQNVNFVWDLKNIFGLSGQSYPCSGKSGDITWGKKMYEDVSKPPDGIKESNNFLPIAPYTRNWTLNVNLGTGCSVVADKSDIGVGEFTNVHAKNNDSTNITSAVTWTSDKPAIADFDPSSPPTTPDARVKGISPGVANVGATVAAVSCSPAPINVSTACVPTDCGTETLCEGDTLLTCKPHYCTNGGTCALTEDRKGWTCKKCDDTIISCTPEPEEPIPGECGTANGKAVCDGRALTPSELCNEGEPSPLQPKTDGYEVVWTCGDPNNCGGETVSCSAKGKKSCGWIETNP